MYSTARSWFISTGLRRYRLRDPEGVPQDVTAASIFGIGVSSCGSDKFPRVRRCQILDFFIKQCGLSSFVDVFEQVEGLETIRAFGCLGEAASLNTASLDQSQRSEFLLMCLQRWLNLVLDMIAATVAIGIILGAVGLREQLSGGNVGVALNIILVANTTLLRLIESWTNLEVSLGAVSRLQTLESTTTSEFDENDIFHDPPEWPIHGRVEFEEVTAAYQ